MPMIVTKMIVPRKLIILLVLGSSPGQATRVRVSEPNRGAGAMLLRPLRDGHIRSITIRLIGRPAGNGEAYVERAASDHTLARAVAIATSEARAVHTVEQLAARRVRRRQPTWCRA
jgi:hypothetical protein